MHMQGRCMHETEPIKESNPKCSPNDKSRFGVTFAS